MANRTVNLYGNVMGNSADLTVTFNGTQVFSGTVNSINTSDSSLPSTIDIETQILATFEVDEAISGGVPAIFEVSGGDVTIQRLEANHLTPLGDDGTGNVITETSEEYTSFGAYSQGGWADKNSIFIDDVTQGGTNNSYSGSWHILVPNGSTMKCNFST